MLVMAAWSTVVPVESAIDPKSDVAVKAAFLYNFARFVEWKSLPPGGALTVCIVGDARITSALLDVVRDQKIDGHALDVRTTASDGPLRSCDIVFVSTSVPRHAQTMLESLTTLPILTVGDGKGFAQSSGIIEFLVEDGRMRFAINTDSAERAGLRLSSRLLGLARIVRAGATR
jgi:hypothetical protein